MTPLQLCHHYGLPLTKILATPLAIHTSLLPPSWAWQRNALTCVIHNEHNLHKPGILKIIKWHATFNKVNIMLKDWYARGQVLIDLPTLNLAKLLVAWFSKATRQQALNRQKNLNFETASLFLQ